MERVEQKENRRSDDTKYARNRTSSLFNPFVSSENNLHVEPSCEPMAKKAHHTILGAARVSVIEEWLRTFERRSQFLVKPQFDGDDYLLALTSFYDSC